MNEAVTSCPARVEMDVLHQHLTGALGDATVNLTMQEQGIEHSAEIIDHAVACDVDLAGFPIDLQFADMAAVRIIVHWRVVNGGREQSRLHAASVNWRGRTKQRRSL